MHFQQKIKIIFVIAAINLPLVMGLACSQQNFKLPTEKSGSSLKISDPSPKSGAISNDTSAKDSGLPSPDTDGILAPYGAFGSVGCRTDINPWHSIFYAVGPGNFSLSTAVTSPSGVVFDAVRVVNVSSSYLQLNSVMPEGDFHGATGEYAVSMDMDVARTYIPYDTDPHSVLTRHPYQPWMGVGEVGDVLKVDASASFGELRWSEVGIEPVAIPTGVSIPPGSCAIIAGYTNLGPMQKFNLTLAVQQRGLILARQPQIDKINICDGTDQYTPAQPWTNTLGRNLHIKGATLAIATPTGLNVDVACLQILGLNGLPSRRIICSVPGGNAVAALATQGAVEFPEEILFPGEQVIYQARHKCSAGYWGATAYLHMW